MLAHPPLFPWFGEEGFAKIPWPPCLPESGATTGGCPYHVIAFPKRGAGGNFRLTTKKVLVDSVQFLG